MSETRKSPDLEAVRRGAVIKALREAYGLSAAELGPAVGITRRYLSYIEAGSKLAPVVLCRKIADHLGVPLAAITVADRQQADANGSAA